MPYPLPLSLSLSFPFALKNNISRSPVVGLKPHPSQTRTGTYPFALQASILERARSVACTLSLDRATISRGLNELKTWQQEPFPCTWESRHLQKGSGAGVFWFCSVLFFFYVYKPHVSGQRSLASWHCFTVLKRSVALNGMHQLTGCKQWVMQSCTAALLACGITNIYCICLERERERESIASKMN